MSSQIPSLVLILVTGWLLWHAVSFSAELRRVDCRGRRRLVFASAIAIWFIAGGAFGMCLGWLPSPVILLAGTAIKMIFDRRGGYFNKAATTQQGQS